LPRRQLRNGPIDAGYGQFALCTEFLLFTAATRRSFEVRVRTTASAPSAGPHRNVIAMLEVVLHKCVPEQTVLD